MGSLDASTHIHDRRPQRLSNGNERPGSVSLCRSLKSREGDDHPEPASLTISDLQRVRGSSVQIPAQGPPQLPPQLPRQMPMMMSQSSPNLIPSPGPMLIPKPKAGLSQAQPLQHQHPSVLQSNVQNKVQRLVSCGSAPGSRTSLTVPGAAAPAAQNGWPRASPRPPQAAAGASPRPVRHESPRLLTRMTSGPAPKTPVPALTQSQQVAAASSRSPVHSASVPDLRHPAMSNTGPEAVLSKQPMHSPSSPSLPAVSRQTTGAAAVSRQTTGAAAVSRQTTGISLRAASPRLPERQISASPLSAWRPAPSGSAPSLSAVPSALKASPSMTAQGPSGPVASLRPVPQVPLPTSSATSSALGAVPPAPAPALSVPPAALRAASPPPAAAACLSPTALRTENLRATSPARAAAPASVASPKAEVLQPVQQPVLLQSPKAAAVERRFSDCRDLSKSTPALTLSPMWQQGAPSLGGSRGGSRASSPAPVAKPRESSTERQVSPMPRPALPGSMYQDFRFAARSHQPAACLSPGRQVSAPPRSLSPHGCARGTVSVDMLGASPRSVHSEVTSTSRRLSPRPALVGFSSARQFSPRITSQFVASPRITGRISPIPSSPQSGSEAVVVQTMAAPALSHRSGADVQIRTTSRSPPPRFRSARNASPGQVQRFLPYTVASASASSTAVIANRQGSPMLSRERSMPNFRSSPSSLGGSLSTVTNRSPIRSQLDASVQRLASTPVSVGEAEIRTMMPPKVWPASVQASINPLRRSLSAPAQGLPTVGIYLAAKKVTQALQEARQQARQQVSENEEEPEQDRENAKLDELLRTAAQAVCSEVNQDLDEPATVDSKDTADDGVVTTLSLGTPEGDVPEESPQEWDEKWANMLQVLDTCIDDVAATMDADKTTLVAEKKLDVGMATRTDANELEPAEQVSPMPAKAEDLIASPQPVVVCDRDESEGTRDPASPLASVREDDVPLLVPFADLPKTLEVVEAGDTGATSEIVPPAFHSSSPPTVTVPPTPPPDALSPVQQAFSNTKEEAVAEAGRRLFKVAIGM